MEVYREFLKKGDMVLLSLCLMASTFGVVMIYSATRWNNNDRAVIVQALATLIGVFLYILITAIDFEVLTKKFWRQIILFNVGFIALVLTPLGTDHDSGNLNWLSIPGVPLEIQPNEIVKMSFILVTAYIISRIQEDEQDISSLLSLSKLAAHAIMMLGVIALICGDMGMCMVYIAITIAMAWAGGVRARYFAIGIGAVVIAFVVIWQFVLPQSAYWEDYRVVRFRVLFDHDLYPEGIGWHQTRSILALGSGELFGQGYMHGLQSQSGSSSSLPARHTDFIFSVIGEELGLVGCVSVLLLLSMIILRCVWVAHKSGTYFSAYVVMGIAGMLLAQIIFNVGMCLFVLPVMGLTLPFFSYGGSSVITLYMAMGMVSSLRARALPSWIRDRGQL